jgi:hypothetical protein
MEAHLKSEWDLDQVIRGAEAENSVSARTIVALERASLRVIGSPSFKGRSAFCFRVFHDRHNIKSDHFAQGFNLSVPFEGHLVTKLPFPSFLPYVFGCVDDYENVFIRFRVENIRE